MRGLVGGVKVENLTVACVEFLIFSYFCGVWVVRRGVEWVDAGKVEIWTNLLRLIIILGEGEVRIITYTPTHI